MFYILAVAFVTDLQLLALQFDLHIVESSDFMLIGDGRVQKINGRVQALVDPAIRYNNQVIMIVMAE